MPKCKSGVIPCLRSITVYSLHPWAIPDSCTAHGSFVLGVHVRWPVDDAVSFRRGSPWEQSGVTCEFSAVTVEDLSRTYRIPRDIVQAV